MRLLFLEDLGDGAGVISGPRALVSHLVTPSKRLAVEIFQGGEGTAGEEAVTAYWMARSTRPLAQAAKYT